MQNDNELLRHTNKPVRNKNLTQPEFKVLKPLRKNQDIIIKPAYNGSAIVIMEKQYYNDEGIRLLSNRDFYEELPTELSGEVIHRINLLVHYMCSRGQITTQRVTYLTTDIDRTQQLYFLPMIHKNLRLPPGRAIVSGFGCSTKNMPIVDFFINSVVPRIMSYTRDFTHIINILNDITDLPSWFGVDFSFC